MCCEDMLDRGRGRERQAISEAVTTASTEDVLLRPPAFPDAPRTLATDSLIGINSSIRHPHMPRPWHPIRALCATKCEKLSGESTGLWGVAVPWTRRRRVLGEPICEIAKVTAQLLERERKAEDLFHFVGVQPPQRARLAQAIQ